MFLRIVLPADGSEFSWRALGPARVLAAQCHAQLEVLQVLLPGQRVDDATAVLRTRIADESVVVTVLDKQASVAATIAEHVDQVPGTMVVMSSVGHGRAAALVGSVTEELLQLMFGAIVVVGPESWVERADFSGELIVPIDGSEVSETALGLAAAWGITLHARPWVVSVMEPGAEGSGDVLESVYPSRVAHRLAQQSDRPVEFEILHHDDPAKAIIAFAGDLDAAFIVASTHGRTGLARARMGSVAMKIVHHAPCPVVLQRPPHLIRPPSASRG